MDAQKTATLTTIFSDVLADLAFIFTEDLPEIPDRPEGDWFETVISYHGPSAGTLKFRCTREFSGMLAANLLGVEPSTHDADARAEDATKEFMNIICGQLVTAIHGAEDVYDLSIPESHELFHPVDLTVTDNPRVSTVNTDGHWVQLEYAPEKDGTC